MNRQVRADDTARWKAAMLRLEDDAFFELMRGALGAIKTPFNKHRLIERLAAFLRRPEVRERAAALLDREDARLLSAVALLDHPDEERLTAFFEREIPFLELHCRLLNLEERLLIYRESPDADGSRPLRLNPYLEETLRSRAVRFETLFPSRTVDTIETEPPWLEDRTLVSTFAFLAHSGEILKTGGGLRKKAENELLRAFPGLAAETSSGTRFSLLLGALRAAGLVTTYGAAVTPVLPVWERFAELTSDERLEIIRAAGILDAAGTSDADDATTGNSDTAARQAPERIGPSGGRTTGGPRGSSGREAGREWPFGRYREIRLRRGTIRTLRSMIEPNRSYERRTLERMMMLARAPGELCGAAAAEKSIRILEDFGLFVRTDEEELALAPHMAAPGSEPGEPSGRTEQREPRQGRHGGESEAVIQPNFTVTLKPFVSLGSGLAAAVCARLHRADVYAELEITRETCGFAFRVGLTKERIIRGLSRLSGAPLPQNIAFSLETWETEFRSVSLYRGLVLRVDEERRYLVEHSRKLAPLILRTLAPGLYLVRDEYERLSKALEDSGIRMIPEVQEPRTPESADREQAGADSDFPEPYGASPFEAMPLEADSVENAATGALPFRKEEPAATMPDRRTGEPDGTTGPSAAEIRTELFEALERAKFPSEIRDALAERIRGRLVLVPEQLDPQVVNRQKTEAKGLDYLGKVRLIEQAIRSGEDFLELNVRSADGTPEKLVVKPDALERRGGELMLEGAQLPGRGTVSVAVSRIGYLRKFRGSFYTA